jgi:hypothetical protein
LASIFNAPPDSGWSYEVQGRPVVAGLHHTPRGLFFSNSALFFSLFNIFELGIFAIFIYSRKAIMMQSALLRARAPVSRVQSLACRIPSSSSRAMGTYATFKVPQINNEPNVSFIFKEIDRMPPLTIRCLETLYSWFSRSQGP